MAKRTQRPETDAQTVRAVDRALQIMSLLNEGREAITLKDVLADTKLPKTTAIRLIQTLERNGLLQAKANGELIGGLALMRWAALAAKTWTLPSEATAVLASLADACRETVNLYVRRDIYRVCLAQEEGPQTLRQVVRVGDQLPLWAGGAAKVLLLEASDELLLAVARTAVRRLARRDITMGRRARELGYATSSGERELGFASIAVPLRNRAGELLASLLARPSERFASGQITEFARRIAEAAGGPAITRAVEHLPPQTS
jgi:DNA-binding IclR family transcriptional regulator